MSKSVAFEIAVVPESPRAAPKELLERLTPAREPLTKEELARKLQRAEENRQTRLARSEDTN